MDQPSLTSFQLGQLMYHDAAIIALSFPNSLKELGLNWNTASFYKAYRNTILGLPETEATLTTSYVASVLRSMVALNRYLERGEKSISLGIKWGVTKEISDLATARASEEIAVMVKKFLTSLATDPIETVPWSVDLEGWLLLGTCNGSDTSRAARDIHILNMEFLPLVKQVFAANNRALPAWRCPDVRQIMDSIGFMNRCWGQIGEHVAKAALLFSIAMKLIDTYGIRQQIIAAIS